MFQTLLVLLGALTLSNKTQSAFGQKCNILLCCTYRPPNSDNSFWKYLSWSIDKASDKSNKIIIIGDLNVDFLNIPRSHPVNDILTGQLLENTIYEPTRVTQNTSTLIDPILVTNEVSVFDC